MEVLASIAKQSAAPGPHSASATPPAPASTSTPTAPTQPLPYTAPPASLPYQQPQQPAYAPPGAPASMPPGMAGFPAQLLAGLGAPGANGAPGGYPSVVPQPAPPAPTPPAAPGVAAPDINQVMLIKTLIDQGLQADQISAILQTMSSGQLPQAAPAYPAAPSQPQDGGWGAGAQSRDYGDRRGGYGDRSRSRSPDRWGRDPHGGYDRHGSGPRGSSRDRGGRPDYRNRSPMGRRDHGTPDHGHEKKQKWVEYDRNMRPGCIKGAYN